MKNIPAIGFILVLINIGIAGNTQTFQPVSEQSSVEFRIKNMGVNTKGTLSGLRGTIMFDEAKLSSSYCKVMVDAASIDTRSKGRDNHIKKSDFLDVQAFPVISFQSTQITALANQSGFRMQGILTIKGISKSVSFPFQAKKEKSGYRFTGEMQLDRLDFGVGESSWILSSSVTVQLNVLAIQ